MGICAVKMLIKWQHINGLLRLIYTFRLKYCTFRSKHTELIYTAPTFQQCLKDRTSGTQNQRASKHTSIHTIHLSFSDVPSVCFT